MCRYVILFVICTIIYVGVSVVNSTQSSCTEPKSVKEENQLLSDTGFCLQPEEEDNKQSGIMATPKYTLAYFNYRWLAEPIRYLLQYAGQDFEDVREDWDEWEKRSQEENLKKYAYGKLPYFVERDETGQIVVGLSQSFTIVRYLARKHNLVGATLVEQAKAEEYADCVKDMLKEVELIMAAGDDQARIKEIRTNLLDKTFPRYLAVVEQDLAAQRKKKGNAEFAPLVGDQVTWVDFILAHFMETFEIFLKDSAGDDERAKNLLQNYPEIKNHMKGIFGLEPIKKWIAERPVTQY